MAVRTGKSKSDIYQLKVTLLEGRPPIWRRLLVPGKTKLPDVHLMLQAAMGWYNCHLHKFEIDGVDYLEPDPEFDDLEAEDERTVRLRDVVDRKGERFLYVYDFGDDWEHEVLVEDIFAPEPKQHYPICVDGARACPPEDCGSMSGYREFLKAIRDPEHEEHEAMLEWVGRPFDSEAFDLAAINAALRDYRLLDARNC